MTDNRLIELHNSIVDYVQYYADGMLTLPEFAARVAAIHSELTADSPLGLLDPVSGLRLVQEYCNGSI
jgi:hypothetical protein